MNEALTYKDLFFSFGKILHVDRFEIDELPDHHGRFAITAVLDADLEKDIFFQVPDEISLLYRQNGEEKVLFFGLLFRSSMKRKGKYLYLDLEARSCTYQMDLVKEIRSFQNTKETGSQIVKEVLKQYPGCICLENFEDGPLEQFLIQYEETDWEFLKRLARKYHVRLYPQVTAKKPSFRIGFPRVREDWQIREDFFTTAVSFDTYEDRKANMKGDVLPQQYLSWTAEGYHIIPLGARLLYRGKEWLVGAVRRRLDQGILKNTYTLVQEETEALPPYCNPLLPGISLDGTIKNVARDQVQVYMEEDTNTRTAGQYWFPYSTVAGSADGSGWYCMPEIGEKIRVYFPEADERGAYVISALSGNTLSNQTGSMDPAVKHISTAQGNTVTFCAGGANISVKGGTGTVNLGSGGDLSITAAESISIYAGSKITFDGNEIVTSADEKIDMAADPGASIKMSTSQIDLKASMIYQN